MDHTVAKTILSYWFPSDGTQDMDKWFMKSKDYDKEIIQQFQNILRLAENGKTLHWLYSTKETFLAHIILLDQMSRHIYREQGNPYQNDKGCIIFTLQGLDIYYDEMDDNEKMFALLPLMHSENMLHQNKCIEYIENEIKIDPKNEFWKNMLKHARGHRDVIQTFGRFPKRNERLKRHSTDEEQTYIDTTDGFY